MRYFTLLFIILFSLPILSADYDIIHLTSGHLYKGKVKRIKNCHVVFTAEGAKYDIPVTTISTIGFGNTNSRVYRRFLAMSEKQVNSCVAGQADASSFHGKVGGHVVLGFLFGPFAVLGAAVANPTPDRGKRTYLMSSHKELFSDPEYIICYKRKAKGQLVGATLVGWGSWVLLVLAL